MFPLNKLLGTPQSIGTVSVLVYNTLPALGYALQPLTLCIVADCLKYPLLFGLWRIIKKKNLCVCSTMKSSSIYFLDKLAVILRSITSSPTWSTTLSANKKKLHYGPQWKQGFFVLLPENNPPHIESLTLTYLFHFRPQCLAT